MILTTAIHVIRKIIGITSSPGDRIWWTHLRDVLPAIHLQFSANLLRLRNDLHCVGWGVKLYSLTPADLQNKSKIAL